MDNTNQVIKEMEQQVISVHDSFWQALGDRDVEKRFSYCDDAVTFIGSGLNEKAGSKEEYMAINRKGIEQYPEKFAINIVWRRVSVSDKLAWVETEVEWTMIIEGRTQKEMLRNTVILKKVENQWLIFHVHGSAPDYRLAGQNYMTNSDTSKRNIELERQVYMRTKELNLALENLRATQSQLIQAEKMASLGELTAGIAHEIQNPLNFVNNFSEVNTELIDELKEELKAGKTKEALVLADDIKVNSEKITFHGKRADSIVKGMLQHSRSGSGQKEATDINNLLDECFRLSFHGMRAKDKSFNAQTNTSFDSSVGLINIESQEIGRVFLNLFTNSFYAVMQKKKDALSGSGGENYIPVVSATTQKEGNTVKIIVRDNGNGISVKAKDKIFQPFFTTKPTGEGTGLGLSMSYDIITKGHGGELKVETEEGEFAQFTIILPV